MKFDGSISIYENAAQLVDSTAIELLADIHFYILEKGECHIALTGGTLGAAFSIKLVELFNDTGGALRGLHIWLGDERFEPEMSPLRNSFLISQALTNTEIQLHETRSRDDGCSVMEAAVLYERQLQGIQMDICVLGLGPDGHVASLFPNRCSLQEASRVIAIVDSPKPPPERITFTMAYINSSAEVWIIAAGAAKAGAVAQLLRGESQIPASSISARLRTRLILDKSARNAQ